MVSMVSTNHERLGAGIQRDLAVLSSLAHLRWLTTDQLHALCFPGYTLATVRTSLRYFAAAGWVHHAWWRMKASRGSQLWAITLKGRAMVERYLPVTVPHQPLDLARPTTALEQEEYRVQLAVRTLVVRLILEARQVPRLAQLTLALPQGSLPMLSGFQGVLRPDAVLSIVWDPPVVQPVDWVPWLSTAIDRGDAVHYPLYLDRIMHMDHLTGMINARNTPSISQRSLPILILQDEERLTLTQQALQARSHQHPVRVSTWLRLKAGISGETWLDELGHACSLQPRTAGAL